eukprot:1152187-Pelagomonas_calceolata.AAC.1
MEHQTPASANPSASKVRHPYQLLPDVMRDQCHTHHLPGSTHNYGCFTWVANIHATKDKGCWDSGFAVALRHDTAQQLFFSYEIYSALVLGCQACSPTPSPRA